MAEMRPSDESLIEKAQKGDKDSFGLLYEKYSGRILTYLTRYMGNFHKAQDATLETFIKAYKLLPAYKEQGMFLSWLYRIATNTAKSEFRRVASAKTVSLDATAGDGEGPAPMEFAIYEGESQRDNVMRGEVRAMIEKALTKLSPNYREAIILCNLQDMDYAEAARILRISVWTLGSRVARARRQLCKILKVYKKELS